MLNFRIVFERPLFLLLLLPAIAFALIPYFRSPKRYRKTRNRITSIVMHMIVMVLAIAVLAGMTLQYDVPNKDNELILLVDKSHSNEKSNDGKEDFIYQVLRSAGSQFKVGIVTFGYDQVYAATISADTDAVYDEYLRSVAPDDSASDIAAALNYATTLFTKPEAGRIVLLSDGWETDGDAETAIKAVAAQGTKVDTVHFPDAHGEEVQIISCTLPDYTIRHGENFPVTLELQSSYEGEAVVTMYDDATQIGEATTVRLSKGIQTVELDAILPVPGLHKLAFEITSEGDTLAQNNAYNTYVNIEVFDKILVVESIVGESDSLREMMPDMKCNVVNVSDVSKMPKTLDELREYDEVILVNVSNKDMPKGFDELLYKYVNEIGGGLFTVCGNEDDGNPNDEMFTANAFNRDDMYGSIYQQLLPVEIINYTPPVGVIIIIDCSGSMYNPDKQMSYEGSKLFAAQQGAESCLDALTERDYVGIMTFMDSYDETLELTPRPERDKILSAIDSLPKGGGATNFAPAIERAGNALLALTEVEKRHIILVTDGEPTDNEELYGANIKRNAEMGITMSIVGIGCTASARSQMTYVLETYAGADESHFHDVNDINQVPTVMREDLQVPEIKDINYSPFTPVLESNNPFFMGVDQSTMPVLSGFYGSKLKPGAELILSGEYVPLYAQWKVGKGTVGSFMCDLNGTWSKEFIASETGQALVNHMVTALLPSESVRAPKIQLSLKEQNYQTQMNIFTQADETDTVEIKIIPRFANAQEQTLYALPSEGFGRVAFSITQPGVYAIEVTRKDAAGNVIATATTFKSFSYSQEYNIFRDEAEGRELMANLADDGGGVVIADAHEVFANVVKYLHKTIDPRLVFITIVLVAFLLDIAVRKFKFKWPHELIRDLKEKRESAKAK